MIYNSTENTEEARTRRFIYVLRTFQDVFSFPSHDPRAKVNGSDVAHGRRRLQPDLSCGTNSDLSCGTNSDLSCGTNSDLSCGTNSDLSCGTNSGSRRSLRCSQYMDSLYFKNCLLFIIVKRQVLI